MKYIGIRKVKWDGMWHALFEGDGGTLPWDRVSKKVAKRIADQLFKNKKGKQ